MEISKMLTISTAHITEETDKALQHNHDKFEELLFYETGYGYIIWTMPYATLENIPEDLKRCIELARQNDCKWLCLDCDGEIVSELPTYNW